MAEKRRKLTRRSLTQDGRSAASFDKTRLEAMRDHAYKLERERDEARKLADASLMKEAAALEQLEELRRELAQEHSIYVHNQ